MRETVLAAAALLALLSPAAAAGLGEPVSGPPYGPPQGVSWTACYAGGNAGGLWGTSDKWIVRTPGGAFEGQSLGHHDVDGFVAGVQGGCDYQFSGGFVAGVQGGYGWTHADGTHPSERETGVFYHSAVDGLGEVTGRVGYAFDRVLAYVKAGAAWERVDYSAATTQIGTAYRASDTRSGWTLGGGGEYAVTPHLSAFVEYGYYGFGTDTIGLTPQKPGLRRAYVGIDDTANVVRAGINLRFGN
jgi:outer membrane immunogenic protein